MKLSVVAAVAENGVIGRGGDLPWHLSADLRRFKKLTMGHAILMGRKTWESIGRPLPGRVSIVISRQNEYQPEAEGVLTAASLEEATALVAQGDCEPDEAFVIGGAGIYALAMPHADRLLLTRVHAEVDGDVFFPEVDWQQWKLIEQQEYGADEKNDYAHSFLIYQRKKDL